MINWNNRHTLVLIVMLIGLVAIGYYAQSNLLEPKIQVVAEAENRLADQQNLIETIEAEGLTEEGLRVEQDLVELELPKDAAIDQLIIMLDELKDDLNLVIHWITKLDNVSKSGTEDYLRGMEYVKHQVDFSVDRYSDFEQFIQKLNDSTRRIEIDQLTFQQTSTNSVSGTVVYRAFYSE